LSDEIFQEACFPLNENLRHRVNKFKRAVAMSPDRLNVKLRSTGRHIFAVLLLSNHTPFLRGVILLSCSIKSIRFAAAIRHSNLLFFILKTALFFRFCFSI